MALLRDVYFTADDGLTPLAIAGVIELNCAEQIAVVGHGDGRHFLLGDGSMSWLISQAPSRRE